MNKTLLTLIVGMTITSTSVFAADVDCSAVMKSTNDTHYTAFELRRSPIASQHNDFNGSKKNIDVIILTGPDQPYRQINVIIYKDGNQDDLIGSMQGILGPDQVHYKANFRNHNILITCSQTK